MAIPEISPLPDVPVRGEPLEDFSTKANAFFGHFPTLRSEINAATAAITEQTDQALADLDAGIATLAAFGRNLLINGGFPRWQRGTSFTPSDRAYTADRWAAGRFSSATGLTVTRQTGQAAPYALRLQRDSGNSSTAAMYIVQVLDTATVMALRGKTLTVSVSLRCGANFSGGSGNAILFAQASDSDDASVTFNVNGLFSSGSPVTLISSAVPVSTTQSRVTATASVTVPATAKCVLLQIRHTPTGTAGADDWLEIENVQLEVGSAATPFEIRPLALETLLCSWFYEGKTVRTENGSRHIPLSPKRVTPSVSASAGIVAHITTSGFELSTNNAVDSTIVANAEI